MSLWAVQHLPTSCLFYKWWSTYINVMLSIHPTPPFPPWYPYICSLTADTFKVFLCSRTFSNFSNTHLLQEKMSLSRVMGLAWLWRWEMRQREAGASWSPPSTILLWTPVGRQGCRGNTEDPFSSAHKSGIQRYKHGLSQEMELQCGFATVYHGISGKPL